MESVPDRYSALSGMELVKKSVCLTVMAGTAASSKPEVQCGDRHSRSKQTLFPSGQRISTSVVSVGSAILYPLPASKHDFPPGNPVAEAYRVYAKDALRPPQLGSDHSPLRSALRSWLFRGVSAGRRRRLAGRVHQVSAERTGKAVFFERQSDTGGENSRSFASGWLRSQSRKLRRIGLAERKSSDDQSHCPRLRRSQRGRSRS